MKGGRKEIQKKKTFAPASSDFRVQQLLRMRSRKGLKYCPPCPINYRFALCTDSQILDDFLKQYTLYCYLCNTYSTFLFQNLRIRMMHNETQLVVEILLWIRFISDTYCSHLEFLCQIDHEGSDQKPSETQLKSS